MNKDFHYYGTYCAAIIAGYGHDAALETAYSAQFTDTCSLTYLKKTGAPLNAATTQLQSELINERTDIVSRQRITRIWSAFHFLPADLYSPVKGGKLYRNKAHLICGPDGELVKETVELAKGCGHQAEGLALHVLADTWAHRGFAGTPSLVINNTNDNFFAIIEEDGRPVRKRIVFHENIRAGDDLDNMKYIRSVYHASEKSVMNLGHGRAGHLPDYSFARYVYMPAWGGYKEIFKDNPNEYYNAFTQMIYALRYFKGDINSFETGVYDTELVKPYENEITDILTKRQLDASEDWKRLGERLSGEEIPPFDIDAYTREYAIASENAKAKTAAGKFFQAAIKQKSMVTERIFTSGNLLAGFSKRVGGEG